MSMRAEVLDRPLDHRVDLRRIAHVQLHRQRVEPRARSCGARLEMSAIAARDQRSARRARRARCAIASPMPVPPPVMSAT